jgi:small subunit ribosomal protein S4
MGDPRKPKKQFKKPGHPWEAERIKEEIKLKKEYGLSNKREIWRAASKLRNWRTQARKSVSLQEKQREEKEKQLVGKLNKLGVLENDARIDDILALEIRSVLDRRLQSQVYKKGIVNSIKQARQFILHGKIMVDNKVVTAPSYLVQNTNKVQLIDGFTPIIKKVIKIEKPAEEAPAISKEKTDKQVVEELAKKATQGASK